MLRTFAQCKSYGPLPMGDGISADLRPFIAETVARARLLEQAREMAVLDPGVLGGTEPVVRGTHVPVRNVAAAVAAGLPLPDILASYPSLTAEQVELVVLYASVERHRGKPRLPAGARVVLNHPTLDRLRELGLDGMAKGFQDMMANPESRALDHPEWLGLLVEQEATLRQQRRFEARARNAKLRHAATVEDVDFRTARGLDRAMSSVWRVATGSVSAGIA